MASLIPTRTTLRDEVEEEFNQQQLELVRCDLCGEYHPPDLHLTRYVPFDDDEPAEA